MNDSGAPCGVSCSRCWRCPLAIALQPAELHPRASTSEYTPPACVPCRWVAITRSPIPPQKPWASMASSIPGAPSRSGSGALRSSLGVFLRRRQDRAAYPGGGADRQIRTSSSGLASSWATSQPTFHSMSADWIRPSRLARGTPEAGGLTPREARQILHGLSGIHVLVRRSSRWLRNTIRPRLQRWLARRAVRDLFPRCPGETDSNDVRGGGRPRYSGLQNWG